VILMRHAQTTPGTGDPPGFKLDDCATQRNLSNAGRRQAQRIGERLRNEGLDVALVASSQWCRCLDTANLLGFARVEPWPDLNSFFNDRSRSDAQTEAIRAAISNRRGQPGVLVLVTHQVNITALTGIVPPQGGLVIVRADAGDSAINVLGQLRIDAPASP
jgi:phosphohistidine phosphatase SixA